MCAIGNAQVRTMRVKQGYPSEKEAAALLAVSFQEIALSFSESSKPEGTRVYQSAQLVSGDHSARCINYLTRFKISQPIVDILWVGCIILLIYYPLAMVAR